MALSAFALIAALLLLGPGSNQDAFDDEPVAGEPVG
jgi:hypothetical protein